ncbi:N-acetylmuramoyl-L-alanine amidase [Roseovarius indicus]|uniref:N-acetylmuramoyl-L-alanine amidase n=1 Tax=Roseovarius indicus TaxID=540747 RepID=UPI004057DA65
MTIYQGKARYLVREVCLHTAATPGNWWRGKSGEDVLEAFWNWHVVDNGWRKIGYHRVVLPNGTILHDNGQRLRSLYEIPAQVAGHNRGVIGVCMVPVRTHDGIKTFDDYFTQAQRAAVKAYIRELAELTPIATVTGHNDYTSTKECPGFRVKTGDWL